MLCVCNVIALFCSWSVLFIFTQWHWLNLAVHFQAVPCLSLCSDRLYQWKPAIYLHSTSTWWMCRVFFYVVKQLYYIIQLFKTWRRERCVLWLNVSGVAIHRRRKANTKTAWFAPVFNFHDASVMSECFGDL